MFVMSVIVISNHDNDWSVYNTIVFCSPIYEITLVTILLYYWLQAYEQYDLYGRGQTRGKDCCLLWWPRGFSYYYDSYSHTPITSNRSPLLILSQHYNANHIDVCLPVCTCAYGVCAMCALIKTNKKHLSGRCYHKNTDTTCGYMLSCASYHL